MELQDLLFSKEGAIGVITLNNPARMNAMTPGMSEGLLRLVTEVQDDPDIKVIVLTGAGRAFCPSGFGPQRTGRSPKLS